MNKFLLICFLSVSFLFSNEKITSIYDFRVKDIDNKTISLDKYKNKVLLIVNVASQCTFTSQYEGLVKLYTLYKDKDFMVLAFPSNEFSKQEPGTNAEIKNFCSVNYAVDFDLFSKIVVNGDNAIPLYKYLKKEQSGIFGTESIKWNFTKFLINKEGKVVNRYSSFTKTMKIEGDIKELLK